MEGVIAFSAKLVLLRRADDRKSIHLNGTLRVDSESFDIVIEDLSAGGFGARIDADLRPGDRVMIGSPATHVREAEVIWSGNGKMGFAFIKPSRALDVAAARPADTVVPHPATRSSTSRGEFPWPEPSIEKFPLWIRVWTILGASAALWTLILAVAVLASRQL